MKKRRNVLTGNSLFLLALFFPIVLQAEIRLPAIFGSHMVLQQNSPVHFWGWGAPDDEIIILCSWLPGQEFRPKADRTSLRWAIDLPAAAGSLIPQTITIKGGWAEIILDDILFGEVWVCSGQSNMEWQPSWGNVDVTKAQYAAANDPGLRFFTVPHMSVPDAQPDCRGEWRVSSPETMRNFSATAYFFGRELRDRLGIPVGLVNSSWGGTPIEAWMHEADFRDSALAHVVNDRHPVWRYGRTGSLWNGMIAPITSLKIKGFLWYQGETNTYNPADYSSLLEQLAADWRADFKDPDLPFYYVQIAPWRYGTPREGAAVRDEQRRALRRMRNAGMVVVSDIGDITDIHPHNKVDVGKRLAAWALTHTYQLAGVPYSGPLFRDFVVENDRIRVHFDFAENGLQARGADLRCFEIAGADRQFYPATALIDGSSIVVKAAKVPHPVAVRFAFDNTAEPNLFNAEGLPASCFRSDDWPAVWPDPVFQVRRILENGDAELDISCPDPSCKVRCAFGENDPSGDQGFWAEAGKPVLISRGKTLKTRVYDRNNAPADRTDYFALHDHLAAGRPAVANAQASARYPGSAGPLSLTDGLEGTANEQHNAWQGYEGDSLLVWTIDLGHIRRVKQVGAHFLVATGSWIFPPASMQVEISKHGKKYTDIGTLRNELPVRHATTSILNLSTPVGREARFVRISTRNLALLPDWHQGKGKKAWLFVDELVVE